MISGATLAYFCIRCKKVSFFLHVSIQFFHLLYVLVLRHCMFLPLVSESNTPERGFTWLAFHWPGCLVLVLMCFGCRSLAVQFDIKEHGTSHLVVSHVWLLGVF